VSRQDDIAARLAAATPGPWRGELVESTGSLSRRRESWVVSQAEKPWTLIARSYVDSTLSDAALIAAAPDDIAWLLAEVERLRDWITDLDPAARF